MGDLFTYAPGNNLRLMHERGDLLLRKKKQMPHFALIVRRIQREFAEKWARYVADFQS